MHSPWVAKDVAADPVARARLLRRAHEVVLGGYGTPPILRGPIVESWRRCLSAGVDPDRPAPAVLGPEETAARLAGHPLTEVLPAIRALAGAVAHDARQLLAIAGADGLLLHAEGHPSMLEAAEQPGFLPGRLCSETAVGTNAIGTALEIDHALQVFSAEHFNRLLHGWASAAAPVHDPRTGATLGAIGLCGPFRSAHPHTLSLAGAVARVAEAELERALARREAQWRDRYFQLVARASRSPSALVDPTGAVLTASPPGWAGARVDLVRGTGPVAVGEEGMTGVAEPLGGGAHVVWGVPDTAGDAPRPVLRLRLLGVPAATAWADGVRLRLGLRHSELVALLALARDGVGGGELARGLYGPGAPVVTLRAEIARLRRVLGMVVAHNPYRLLAEVHADVLEVEHLLQRGDLDAARARYSAPLLPASRAPAIVAARRRIELRLRNPRATVAVGPVERGPSAMLALPGGGNDTP
jgi:hypothetical protein